ncbi:MAG TPA: serine hydrolase [Bacteroidales bacterium]|nr:serine hydrolase [Bacteroidales bacterium]
MKGFLRQTAYFLLLALILQSCGTPTVKLVNGKLPRSTPEAEGVDSRGIIGFLNAANADRHEFHSFMFLRHGKVITEGWWSPYSAELKHTLYSGSKSFTSSAVGFAVSENKLKVTDKVISFFPGYLPDTVSKNLSNMEVRDLLTMTAGQDPDPTFLIPPKDSNWVKAFLARPVVNKPGTKFLYNSMATYMLSAIIQKATGQKLLDYLSPRLFGPLNIEGADWETDPMGVNTGGWGLRLKTEDLAKFGQLYLQQGRWEGTQVLPKSWVKEATSFKIDQRPGAPDSIRKKSDWAQGYCYQFWRCRNNAFRGDGAFGQFIIVMPEKDAVVAITSETPDMQEEIDLVWKYLLPAIHEKSLQPDPESDKALKVLTSGLAVRLPAGSNEQGSQSDLAGRTFKLDPNPGKLETLGFSFTGSECTIRLLIEGKDYSFSFGKDSWVTGMTNLRGPNLLMRARNHFSGIGPVKIAGIYRWRDKKTIEMTLRFIESPHHETVTCTFDKNKISINRKISFMPEYRIPELDGKISN